MSDCIYHLLQDETGHPLRLKIPALLNIIQQPPSFGRLHGGQGEFLGRG